MPFANSAVAKEYHREASRRWAEKNPDRRREINRISDRRRGSSDARRKSQAEDRQRRHVRQRLKVLDRYGGCCAFCGTDQYEHLTIDHIKGGGSAHRLEIRSRYRNLTDYLARTEVRRDLYRILCWNCHMAQARFGVEPGGRTLRGLDHWRAFSALRRKENGT